MIRDIFTIFTNLNCVVDEWKELDTNFHHLKIVLLIGWKYEGFTVLHLIFLPTKIKLIKKK